MEKFFVMRHRNASKVCQNILRRRSLDDPQRLIKRNFVYVMEMSSKIDQQLLSRGPLCDPLRFIINCSVLCHGNVI